LRMRGEPTMVADNGKRGNQSLSKVTKPQMIDRDPGGQWIFLTGNPAGQGQAPARAALGVQLSDGCILFIGCCQSSRGSFELFTSCLHFLFPSLVRLFVSRLR